MQKIKHFLSKIVTWFKSKVVIDTHTMSKSYLVSGLYFAIIGSIWFNTIAFYNSGWAIIGRFISYILLWKLIEFIISALGSMSAGLQDMSNFVKQSMVEKTANDEKKND